MKRTTLLAALTTTLAAAIAISGVASGAGYRQTVEGSIAVMMGESSTESGCYAAFHRRIAAATQEQLNGIVGYHFDVDKRTWNKPFRLVASGPQPVDLDLIFYREFGTGVQAADPTYNPETVRFQQANSARCPRRTTEQSSACGTVWT